MATEKWSGIGPDKRGMYHLIPVGSISITKNIRKTFDKQRLQELADSLNEYGILQPLVVRVLEGGETYELVAGERRLRAAKMAGIEKVPCRVVDLTAKQAAEIQLLENLQRADLNALEEAQALADLISEHGYTQEQLAAKLGKSQPWVASRIGLLEAPPAAQDAITRGIWTASHGEIARNYANAPEVVAKVAKDAEQRHIPVARLRDEIEEEIRKRYHRVFKLGRDWDAEEPRFDVNTCLACENVVRARRWYGSTDKPSPYCTNTRCWEAKQEAALKSVMADDAVDTSKLPSGSYTYMPDSGDWSQCEGCESLKYTRGGSRVCLNVKCYRKLKSAEEKAKARAAADAKSKAIANVMLALAEAGYIDSFRGLPKRLQVLIASLIFTEVRPPGNEQSKDDKDVFRELVGWTDKLEKWYLTSDGYPKLVSTLEKMEPEALADALFHWLFWGKTPDKNCLRLKYLLEESTAEFSDIDPMDIPVDIDDELAQE